MLSMYKMNKMNKIVFGNLGLLDIYLQDQKLISEGCELTLIDKDDYDTVSKVKELEYPIYYTYNEILNIISYDNDLSYSKKVDYLEKVYDSLDVLIQYIDDYHENENTRICYIVDNIYARYEIVKSQILYKNPCSEKIVFLFDQLVDSFREANRYLYFSPALFYPLMNLKPGEFLDDSDDSCQSDSGEEEEDFSDDSEKDEDDDEGDDEGSSVEDDELEKDTSKFSEFDYEGVEYLEDEETSDIYNCSQQLVGKWNEDADNIIWSSDSFREAHETMKDK
uniref:Uncharacterized protein n=1 Tax=viral metagenome TaxID=1070528 RepID=A0A6C0FD92_9ZZZZ